MKKQLQLFKPENDHPSGDRDGATYQREFDLTRLNRQAREVWRVMSDSKWHTLYEISEECEEPEASISARLRDFRKEKFGAHKVERQRRGESKRGLFEYRLTPAEEETL